MVPVDMVPWNHQNTKYQEIYHFTLAHLRCSGIVLALHPVLAHHSIILVHHSVVLALLEGGIILTHVESKITPLTCRGSNFVIDPIHVHLESSIKALVRQEKHHVIIRGLTAMKLIFSLTVGIRTT